jgi:hypothetical protein
MKVLWGFVFALSYFTSFAAHAVEEKCGTFHWYVENELYRTPLIAFKTLVTEEGETVVFKAPFIGVTEAATDAIAALKDGDEVCYKANEVITQGKKFYVFSVNKK